MDLDPSFGETVGGFRVDQSEEDFDDAGLQGWCLSGSALEGFTGIMITRFRGTGMITRFRGTGTITRFLHTQVS